MKGKVIALFLVEAFLDILLLQNWKEHIAESVKGELVRRADMIHFSFIGSCLMVSEKICKEMSTTKKTKGKNAIWKKW